MKSNTIILLTNEAMTGTAQIVSSPLALDQIYGLAIQAIWTGTPNGTFKVQASVQSPPTQTQVSNGGPDGITEWTDIAGSTSAATGSSGDLMWNIDAAFFRYIRLVYNNTSGTGVLNAKTCVKGI